MTERSDLHRGDRNLLADTRPASLRECTPSMDEVSCKLEVSPRHCAQSVLMWLKAVDYNIRLFERQSEDGWFWPYPTFGATVIPSVPGQRRSAVAGS